jgi:glycosyltransferase involved in cell wall biosynthesis
MRILWLKTELLHPVDKGGKIRTYYMLKELKRTHHVTYLALDDGMAAHDAVEKASEYCDELIRIPHQTRPKFSAGFYCELASNLLSPLPYFMKKYESQEMRRHIEMMSGKGLFDVLVCDFLQPSVNVPMQMTEPTVLFQHNVEAMIWKRHFEVQSNPLKKAYLYGQWKKCVSYESSTCRRFDHVIAVSKEDVEMMERDYNCKNISDVPTGVDTGFYRSSGQIEIDPSNLVFTGSMDWLPNEDAIQWFTKEIFPLIKLSVPKATVTIVGRNPYASLVELSKRDTSIVVTGRVDDVRPYIEKAAAYIVPIRVGGGTRLKIYEAMAMQKPIISTTIGAEGLPVRDGEELLIADTPRSFADSVVRLLDKPEFGEKLGANAAKLVREQYGWDSVAADFTNSCEKLLSCGKSRK